MKRKTSPIIKALRLASVDDLAAVEFLEAQRWGSTLACVRCGSLNVYQMRDRATGERNKDYRWRCRDCKRVYTVRTGTVLEESRLPLRIWCHAFWRACSSKKGVSAKQIERECEISYKSALFLMHRIRWAMTEDYLKSPMMSGEIEVDETYVGGKPRNSGPHNKRGAGTKKTPVVALVERGGNVRAWPLAKVTKNDLQTAIRKNVSPHSRILTDESFAYVGIEKHFALGHHTVKHTAKEYAREEPWGVAHTNTVEGFFSLVKRGMYGTFHSVSKKHLHRYISEFGFRYNARHLDDGARVALAIKKAEGKRLRYREPAA